MQIFTKIWQIARRFALVLFVVVVGGAAAYLATKTSAPAEAGQTQKAETEHADKISRVGADGLVVPDSIAKNVGLKTVVVSAHCRAIQLPPLQGSLALDTNSLARVHSRFAGEVTAIGTISDPPEPSASTQPVKNPPRGLRVGDKVRKGDLLAVVWSKDLGEKKSELVDAASKLNTDSETLRNLTAAFAEGSIPERSIREAERNVESDRIAVEKAAHTLQSWRLSEAEIAAIRAEADRGAKRTEAANWARVEIRSPLDGMILEKNQVVGDIIDTTADVFKVGDLSRLAVWVHIFEEDLPLLQSLPKPVRWTVQIPSRPGVSFPGQLEQVRPIIDTNQHTALATGHVDNPQGDLIAGQAVTVSLELPPPLGEVELPSDGVVEDGRDSVVFAKAGDHFVRTPVQVTRRFRDVVCIRAGGLKAGDVVVTAGSLLLRDAMDDLPAPK